LGQKQRFAPQKAMSRFTLNSDRRSMSALGQKQTFAAQKGMSALPQPLDVCFVPKVDFDASIQTPGGTAISHGGTGH
jgi:hypothetical protein